MVATIVISAITFLLVTISIVAFPFIKIKGIKISTYWLIALIGALILLSSSLAPINEVYKEMHDKIHAYQTEPDSDANEDMDKFLNTVIKFPRFLLRFVMRLLYYLDYHGMIPKSLLENTQFLLHTKARPLKTH